MAGEGTNDGLRRKITKCTGGRLGVMRRIEGISRERERERCIKKKLRRREGRLVLE